MDEKEKKEQNSEEQPENGVKAKWGAFWIFLFVIVVYALLDWFVLTPFLEWLKK